MANPNFGKVTGGGSKWDPRTLEGWGVRGYNWEFSAGVQREVIPQVSVDLSYFRRSYGNLTVIDDRALSAADFDTFGVPAPTDARLPDGGGYTVGGFRNLKPTSFGRPSDNYVTFADEYGKLTQRWNGVDVSVNARIRNGLLLQGGLSTGRTTSDNCEIVEVLPELSPLTSQDYCRVNTNFLTQVKLLASYTIPRVDVQLSGSFQSIPGPEVLANFVAPNALVAPSLGRPLSGGAANVTVNIVEPGTIYGERLNQLDVRLAKILRVGANRTSINLDLYNALNGNAVIQQSNVYGNWQQPQGILVGRSIKVSAQYNF